MQGFSLQTIADYTFDLWDRLYDPWRDIAYRTSLGSVVQRDYSHVLIQPKEGRIISRKDASLELTIDEFKHSQRKLPFSTTPLIGANMDGISTFKAVNAARKISEAYKEAAGVQEAPMSFALRKHYTAEEIIEHHRANGPEGAWLTIGVKATDFSFLNRIMTEADSLPDNMRPDKVCIDTPNGYIEQLLPFMVERVRKKFPEMVILAGNIIDKHGVRMMDDAGADIVKIGIGPGSVCTTRKMTGVGRPQLSAVIESSREAIRRGIMTCADGGCTNPGDVAKAFAAGANFVMLGGMLSGIEEGLEEGVVEKITGDDGKEYVEFYGSSSTSAMNKHHGGVATHRSSEGKVVRRPLRGTLSDVLSGDEGILGGIRSTMTYVGAATIKELPQRAQLGLVDNQINNVFGPS